MAPFPLELETLTFATKDESLSVVLGSLISLDLPDHVGFVSSPERLKQLVQSGELWIVRRGACSLHVVVMVEDLQGLTDSLSTLLVDAVHSTIGSLQLWNQLGLRAIPVTDNTLPANVVSFVLEPPDLPCSVAPPPEVSVASFRRLSCSLYFHCSSFASEKNGPVEPTVSSFRFDASETEENCASHETQEYTRRGLEDQYSTSPPVQSQGKIEAGFPGVPVLSAFNELIEMGINTLLVGRRQVSSFAVVKGKPSPSLVDLAPAVFNMRFLQAIYDRARFSDVISSVIRGLAHAQSPQLRKTALNTAGLEPACEKALSSIVNAIENNESTKLWRLIVSKTKTPAIKMPKTSTADRRVPDLGDVPSHPGGQTLSALMPQAATLPSNLPWSGLIADDTGGIDFQDMLDSQLTSRSIWDLWDNDLDGLDPPTPDSSQSTREDAASDSLDDLWCGGFEDSLSQPSMVLETQDHLPDVQAQQQLEWDKSRCHPIDAIRESGPSWEASYHYGEGDLDFNGWCSGEDLSRSECQAGKYGAEDDGMEFWDTFTECQSQRSMDSHDKMSVVE